MSNKKDVKAFLGRLGSTLDAKESGQALRNREEQNLTPYVQNKVWPGKNFIYIGHSSNLDYRLVGTDADKNRTTCLSLLFEAKGDNNYCVPLNTALNFEGFAEILSRFEKDLLMRLPEGTMLSPTYNANGERLHSSFTIWQELTEVSTNERVLVEA